MIVELARLCLVAVGVWLLVAAPAQAQPTPAGGTGGGQVLSIGFGRYYEPTSWIPMRVRLQPPGGETGAYLLRVHQRDLDGDRVTYERSVVLTGGAGPQDFWTYFKLEPTAGDFVPSQDLRVVLADADGREVAQLAVPSDQVRALEASMGFVGNTGLVHPGRLMLIVSGSGGFYPGTGELSSNAIVGTTDTNAVAALTLDDLPDRAIGYEAVDAVVWQDADPAELLAGGGERMTALRQWLRKGGKLIVTHRSDWQSLQPIFDLLPVTPVGVAEIGNLLPLRRLALDRGEAVGPASAYENARGPFRYVLGVTKPEAIVERWLDPTELPESVREEFADVLPDGRSPLLARMPYGFGCISWLAIDLANSNVTGPPDNRTVGWTAIWAALMDVGDRPMNANPDDERDRTRLRFAADEFRDLGAGPLAGTKLAGKSVALVTLALIFFIGYWLLAGPGLYFYLATKKKAHLSWFAFGAAAVGAALLTVGVTRLVLRGPAELRHVSVLRAGRMAPQTVEADVGLYIPRDGSQRISIENGAPETLPTITAFVPPTDPLALTGRTNPISYTIRLDPPTDEQREGLEGAAAVVDIPYRSTLKKLEMSWSGETLAGIEGTPRLEPGSLFPVGTLVNTGGYNLRNVHIVYKYPRGGQQDVLVLYLRQWNNGQTFVGGLREVFDPPDGNRARTVSQQRGESIGPPRDEPVFGFLRQDWANQYWYKASGMRQLTMSAIRTFDDWNDPNRITPVLLSLFSMLPPMENSDIQRGTDATALLRRGAREWDVTAAVSAGNLVVIGEALEQPVPLPLQVEGEAIDGTGTIIVQYIVPLDRAPVQAAEREAFLQSIEQDEPTDQTTRPDEAE